MGVKWESRDDIGKAFINYFSNLFIAEVPDDQEECLSVIKRRVTSKCSIIKRIYRRGG